MPQPPLPYPPSPLTDGRVAVRPWAERDVHCVEQASADPALSRFTTVPSRYSPAEGLAFVHRQWSRAVDGTGVSQAVVDAATDEAVGLLHVGLRPQERVAGLGYWLVPAMRGRGIASAAVRLVVPWAFEALALQRLEAWVVPDNVASQRVLERCGFEREGLLRSFLRDESGPLDVLVYAVVR